MPRWVYTAPRRAAARRTVPTRTPVVADVGFIVARRRRIAGPRLVLAQKPLVQRGPGVFRVPSLALRLIMRARAAMRFVRQRQKRFDRLSLGFQERGTGYPKGANAMAGSFAGDNACAGSRKGWSV